jgi:hypothetical protein
VDTQTCDNCGSTISAAIQVLLKNGFVSKNKNVLYRLVKEPVTDIPIQKDQLLRYLNQGPVICNMYIRKSQASFLDKPPSDSALFGKTYDDDNDDENIETNFYGNDGAFAFPPTVQSESKEKFGHCVVIVGCNRQKTKFRVRNSFGRHWGFNGDFFLTEHHVNPSTIHQLVFIPFHCISIF